MKKLIASSIVALSTTLCANQTELMRLPFMDIEVEYKNIANITKKVTLKRENYSYCKKTPITPDIFWSQNMAHSDVDKICKKIFVTSRGMIRPMIYQDGVTTIGELELLKFIQDKSSKDSSKYLLVDTRTPTWYEKLTIPSSINIPYYSLIKEEFLEDDYYNALNTLGIKIVDEKSSKFDFSSAKEIAIFCNGAWCSQSSKFMNNLIKIGYPKDKILWYRGGMHSWLSYNFTTISPSAE
jgi:rhodanese-related sulfurtransferase